MRTPAVEQLGTISVSAVTGSDDRDRAEVRTPVRRPIYFVDVVLVTPQNPQQIDLIRAANTEDPPTPMMALVRQIGELSRIIRRIFSEAPAQKKSLFELLHKAADLGLRGDQYSVDSANSDLTALKAHIVDEFSTVRDAIWWGNLRFVGAAVLAAVPGFVLFYAAQRELWGVPQVQNGVFHPAIAAAIAAFWIPLGAAIGLFLEFSYSVDREMKFDDLVAINPGRWRPGQRLLNTMLTAYCFAAIMALKAIEIGVLSILLNDFATTQPLLSFAVGFVAGFAFPYVRDLIFKFRPVQRE